MNNASYVSLNLKTVRFRVPKSLKSDLKITPFELKIPPGAITSLKLKYERENFYLRVYKCGTYIKKKSKRVKKRKRSLSKLYISSSTIVQRNCLDSEWGLRKRCEQGGFWRRRVLLLKGSLPVCEIFNPHTIWHAKISAMRDIYTS